MIKDKFDQLIGLWKISRTISDYGVVSGFATFTLISNNKTKNTIHYIENVEVKPYQEKQKTWKAQREYFYEYHKNNNKIIKFFKDGKVFYELIFETNLNKAQAIHLCGLDSYHAIYEFLNFNELNIKYTVIGPNKNYVIESELIRK